LTSKFPVPYTPINEKQVLITHIKHWRQWFNMISDKMESLAIILDHMGHCKVWNVKEFPDNKEK
jgi:hypothetical protein